MRRGGSYAVRVAKKINVKGKRGSEKSKKKRVNRIYRMTSKGEDVVTEIYGCVGL